VGHRPGGAALTGDAELLEASSVPDVNRDGTPAGHIAGRVAKTTGHDLKNVCFAFTYEAPGTPARDLMFYVPTWKKDETLDLLRTHAAADWILGDEKFDKVIRGTAGVTTGFLDDLWG